MARNAKRPYVELQVERSLGEFSFEQSVDGATPWVDEMFLRFVDRVENWIRPKLSWDDRDLYDHRQMASDIVTEANEHRRENKLVWTICDMIAMCSTIANCKIANTLEHATCKKNSAILKSIDAEASFDLIDLNRDNRPDFEVEFQESFDHIWNALDEKQKRIAELSQDANQTDKTIAEKIRMQTPHATFIMRGALPDKLQLDNMTFEEATTSCPGTGCISIPLNRFACNDGTEDGGVVRETRPSSNLGDWHRIRTGGTPYILALIDPPDIGVCIVSHDQFACRNRRECHCELDEAVAQQKCQTNETAAWSDSDWMPDFVSNGWPCGFVD